MTPERLADWEALCHWLEEQPYNASYQPRCRGAYLTTVVPSAAYGTKEARREWRQIETERRRLKLVFWSSGHGWRLHKDYKETLARLRAEASEAPL